MVRRRVFPTIGLSIVLAISMGMSWARPGPAGAGALSETIASGAPQAPAQSEKQTFKGPDVNYLANTGPYAPHDVTGPQKIIILRVYFADYPNASTYSLADVQGFGDQLNTLWTETSYNTISLDVQVSDLFQLPDNRSAYIDDFSDGDLSNGGKFDKVLNDAIANSPAGLDWTDIAAVTVLMAETDTSQFHRGQGGKCNLPMGPGGSQAYVGCAIFSENPSATVNETWGRMAHELGHAFQAGTTHHPSNYNSEFELMDHNYPGQTGVFEKLYSGGFPGWMPAFKYVTFNATSGGGLANIWAEEYDPSGKPNAQAVKAEITGGLYYLVSVRRRILGDDLHANDPWHVAADPNGIPDEGVLIERVVEGGDPMVTVEGPGGDRNKLWAEGGQYSNAGDGIFITVRQKIDEDNYEVYISYDEKASIQPDVSLDPWVSPPGNTWETTDIWIDSPVNGYDTYTNGFWNDLSGNPVPQGNGDAPAIGLVNRLYARVRNIGGQTATNVVVHWQLTDPPGVGIAGATGWVELGSVDQTSFPGLAAISPGDFVDVYMDWTPNFPIPEGDLDNGLFAFHTCLRVILDHVAGETVFGNQDGDGEQENIDYFQAPETGGGAPSYFTFNLFNDDLVNPKWFYLSYDSTLPGDWGVDLNGSQYALLLNPGETRKVSLTITPGTPGALGDIFGVDVKASSFRMLENNEKPGDIHPEFKDLGGLRFEVRTKRPPTLNCKVEKTADGYVFDCNFSVLDFDKFYDPENPFTVLLVGLDRYRHIVPGESLLATVQSDGSFGGTLPNSSDVTWVSALYAGSLELGTASAGNLLVGTLYLYLPMVDH